MADLRKRRAWLIAVTVVGFVAISVIGSLIGKAIGWDPFAISAITAFFAVSFAAIMTDRIRKLK
jgi:Kef-type K+ transport system membrane component KefB